MRHRAGWGAAIARRLRRWLFPPPPAQAHGTGVIVHVFGRAYGCIHLDPRDIEGLREFTPEEAGVCPQANTVLVIRAGRANRYASQFYAPAAERVMYVRERLGSVVSAADSTGRFRLRRTAVRGCTLYVHPALLQDGRLPDAVLRVWQATLTAASSEP